MATPSAPPLETEPISLELFNRAAADLDAKGAIQLKRYKVSKQEKLIMEATYEFALSGELIDFTLHHILEGRSTTPALFN